MNPVAVRRSVRAGFLVGLLWLAHGDGRSFCAAEDGPPAQPSDRVLVLQNGRILRGRISRSPNGYVVEHSAGKLVVPFDEVRVVGESIDDAYHRLRESFAEPTASTHYDLARWCWTHHLRDDARAELVLALDRDPDFEPARDLLERIDEQIKTARRRTAASSTRNGATHGDAEQVESLAGLSRQTAARFSMRVQPLLINKCGNASCHGPQSTSAFQLESTGGHRIHTERNLATVMEYIDLERPDRSRLLAELTGNHGGMNRALFFGSTGAQQLKLIQDWVDAVAGERTKQEQRRASRPSVVGVQPKFPPTVEQAAGEEEEPGDEDESTSNASVSADVASDSADDAEDAFDPEVFNRRFHGASQEKSRRRRPSRAEQDQEHRP